MKQIENFEETELGSLRRSWEKQYSRLMERVLRAFLVLKSSTGTRSPEALDSSQATETCVSNAELELIVDAMLIKWLLWW